MSGQKKWRVGYRQLAEKPFLNVVEGRKEGENDNPSLALFVRNTICLSTQHDFLFIAQKFSFAPCPFLFSGPISASF